MSQANNQAAESARQNSTWMQRYSNEHRLERILEFPAGITPPKRVRIYSRRDHYVLQWWDRAEKKTLSERVEGDMVQAIFRAREIDERLKHFRGSGLGRRSVRHRELVEQFTKNLHRRADAGEIDPRTVVRYESALQHYVTFVEQPHVSRAFPSATKVNRDFVLDFTAFLKNLPISPNGHPNTPKRRMANPKYVLDVTRALFRWATERESPTESRSSLSSRITSETIISSGLTIATTRSLIVAVPFRNTRKSPSMRCPSIHPVPRIWTTIWLGPN